MIIVVQETSQWKNGDEHPVYTFIFDGVKQDKIIEANSKEEALLFFLKERINYERT